jgi:hypothetical protein
MISNPSISVSCIAFASLSQNINCELVYCFDDTYQDEANASFLLGSLLALCMNWTPEQAGVPLMSPWSPFKLRSFRDATFAPRRTPTSPRPATPEGTPVGVGRAGARIATAGAPPRPAPLAGRAGRRWRPASARCSVRSRRGGGGGRGRAGPARGLRP